MSDKTNTRLTLELWTENLLIEVRFRDGQEASVPMCPYGEDKWLTRQYGQLTHQLSWVSHEQTRVHLSVNHPLVNMKRARDHKLHTYILRDTHPHTVKQIIWTE